MPHDIGSCSLTREHEGFQPPPFACGDLLHATARSNRPILVGDGIGIAFALVPIAVLDQEPVVATAALTIVTHAHDYQLPSSFSPASVNFSSPLRSARSGSPPSSGAQKPRSQS